MKFTLSRKIDLSHLDSTWQGAYLEFSSFTFKDLRELMGLGSVIRAENPESTQESSDKIMDILKDHFIHGKAPSGNGLVDIKAKDLEELPMEAIILTIEKLQTTQKKINSPKQ